MTLEETMRSTNTHPLTIVAQGNCQADFLAHYLRSLAGLRSGDLTVLVVRNYGYKDIMAELGDEALDRIRHCDILIRQVDNTGAHSIDPIVPTSAFRLRIPVLRLHCLWPFATAPHPRNRPMPFLSAGPYPLELGDSLLNQIIKRFADEKSMYLAYLDTDVAKKTDLDRLFEVHAENLRNIEMESDFQYWSMIEKSFRDRKLFSDFGHPTWGLFEKVVRDIFQALPIGISNDELEVVIRRAASRPRLTQADAPIHPAIARHFGLHWCTEGTRFKHHSHGWFTHSEFVRRYIRFDYDEDLCRGVWLINSRSDLKEAERVLRSSLDRDPSNGEAAYFLSVNLMLQNLPQEALTYINRALMTLQVPDDRACAHLGYVLGALKQFDAAAIAYERAISLMPLAPWYLHGLAMIEKDRNRKEVAAQLLEQATALDPFEPAFKRREEFS